MLKKKTISVAARKSKGRELQKWCCQKISKITGYAWGKDCPIESRPMGQAGVDIRMENCVLKLFPYSVECKRQEKWAINNWMKQAQENEESGTHWLLIARSSRQRPVVILDAEHFFSLFKPPKNEKIFQRREK
jgi:hypothetical protein